MLEDTQTRYRLLKWGVRVEVGVCHAAVARPEAGIDRELGEIGEAPSGLVRAVRLTARQYAEMGKIRGTCAFCFQIIAEKGGVADFVVGIVVDVLRHVPVEELQRLCKGCVPASES